MTAAPTPRRRTSLDHRWGGGALCEVPTLLRDRRGHRSYLLCLQAAHGRWRRDVQPTESRHADRDDRRVPGGLHRPLPLRRRPFTRRDKGHHVCRGGRLPWWDARVAHWQPHRRAAIVDLSDFLLLVRTGRIPLILPIRAPIPGVSLSIELCA